MKTLASSLPAPRRVLRPCCPQCGDVLIASTVSVHVSDNDVRHWWSCDDCGHEFMTVVHIFRRRPRPVS